jgi:PAS domain S-box-containing protein
MAEDKKNGISKEQEILEESFKKLEKYLDELKESYPVPICALSLFGVIVDINKTAEDLTGYKDSELKGKPVEILFSSEKEIIQLIKEARGKEKAEKKEVFLVDRSKREIPVSVSISLKKNTEGNPVGYFLTLTDITTAKEYQRDLEKRTRDLEESRVALMNMLEDVEEARKEAEEEKDKTIAVIKNFTDGLLLFDRQENLSLANPKAEDIFRLNFQKLFGKKISEFRSFPSLRALAKLCGSKLKEISREELFLKENLIVEVSTIPITARGKKEGTLMILHDVTREKRVEKLKTEFVSLSAHQLRTPLSAIKWTLDMLLKGDLGRITKEQKEYLEKTYKSNERMIGLINDLLNVTRIEEGRYVYNPVLADFQNIVQFVVDSLKEQASKKNLKIYFEKPAKNLPKAKVDTEKIKLAVQNLLNNSISYTPKGGEISIILKEEDGLVKFKISDNGIGLPEGQKDRIFNKFFRGSNAAKVDTGGSGLGLYITKNIIETHGGKIWFEPNKKKGVTFYFTLPAAKNNFKV